MDKFVEEIIIKSFVIKNRQNRLLYELSNSKKRDRALWRLPSYSNIFDSKNMIEIPKPNSNPDDIMRLLKKYGADDKCYVLSPYEDFDGKYIDLNFALRSIVGRGCSSLISCVPDKLLYYEGEQAFGSPSRLIYYKD